MVSNLIVTDCPSAIEMRTTGKSGELTDKSSNTRKEDSMAGVCRPEWKTGCMAMNSEYDLIRKC